MTAPALRPVTRQAGACLEWTGALLPSGYGYLYRRGRLVLAHRYAWAVSGRTLRADLELDHLCRNPRCVAVEHLEPVSPATNRARRGLPPFVRVYAPDEGAGSERGPPPRGRPVDLPTRPCTQALTRPPPTAAAAPRAQHDRTRGSLPCRETTAGLKVRRGPGRAGRARKAPEGSAPSEADRGAAAGMAPGLPVGR